MQKRFFIFLLILQSIFLFSSGCSPTGNTPSDQDEFPDTDTPPLRYEAGFMEIEPVSYSLQDNSGKKTNHTTEQARLWYTFQPALSSPEQKPIFVFFNGGPGSSSVMLFGGNTSKFTIDPTYTGDSDIAPNPYDWAAYGNLLYIDARQTGFSYDLIDDPSVRDEREQGFTDKNFNIFIDAGDFIRVLLRFLASHTSLQKNQVIITGESYGGVRATVMLHILTRYNQYGDAASTLYYDETLIKEIETHFSTVFSDTTIRPFPPDLITSQFPRQILIQPLVAGFVQDTVAGQLLEIPGSPVYRVADETDRIYVPCSEKPGDHCDPINNAYQFVMAAGRDLYDVGKPSNWLFDHSDLITDAYLKILNFAAMTGIDPLDISLMYADQRHHAYRSIDERTSLSAYKFNHARLPYLMLQPVGETQQKNEQSSGFSEFFGTLSLWDDYFISLNYDVNAAFYTADITPYDSRVGEMFLDNLLYVKTFITHAENDIVIYAPAIPACLSEYQGVDAVQVGDSSFTVNFSDGSVRTITFPFYPESCHTVSFSQPGKLFTDVGIWLEN